MEECKKKNGLFYVDLRAYLLSKRNNANETTKELQDYYGCRAQGVLNEYFYFK